MKNYILLLLLATFGMQAQTLQNPTYGKLKLKTNTESTTAEKVNVQETDGTINTISKYDLVNVVEVNDVPSLPLVGEVGKIYVVKNLNKIYRWNGAFYHELAGSDLNYQSIIDALTFTPENVANKATTLTASSTLYPNNDAVIAGLATKEPSFTKNTAFNKNFGTVAGTVAEGNDSRILNGQTAYSWGNHASVGYALTTGSNINQSNFRTALGLGSNAYSSTAYLPLSGGTVAGAVFVNSGYGIGFVLLDGFQITREAGHTAFKYANIDKMKLSSSGLEVLGTVTASPATASNHVVVKSQLDAVANIAGTSGSYTPSLSNLTNISNSSFDSASYTKIGNVVTARVSLFITAVTPSVTAVLDFLLPVPRVSTNVTGIGLGSSFEASMVVNTNSNTTTARLSYQPLVPTNHQVVVMFQYIVD